MRYFDHSATTPLHPQVLEHMRNIDESLFGNPSSTHRYGKESRVAVETARKQVADTIGCSPYDIIFTGGGTESNNLVLWNLLFQKKKHVITSAIEHPAVLEVLQRLKELGVTSTILSTDKTGRVNPEDVQSAVTDQTGLISIMAANNETGVIQPIREISEIAKENQISFHSDGVQILGKIPVSIQDMGVDMMSFSAHKFYGPKGVGVLYIRKDTELRSIITGGGQERNLRAGTENIPGIAGLGLAAEIAAKTQPDYEMHLRELSNIFIKSLKEKYPKLVLNSHKEYGLPGVMNISIPDITSDIMLIHLDMKGFAISNGSACSSGVVKPSHALKAMGISNAMNIRSLRISFGRDNSISDVDDLVEAILDILKKHTGRR